MSIGKVTQSSRGSETSLGTALLIKPSTALTHPSSKSVLTGVRPTFGPETKVGARPFGEGIVGVNASTLEHEARRLTNFLVQESITALPPYNETVQQVSIERAKKSKPKFPNLKQWMWLFKPPRRDPTARDGFQRLGGLQKQTSLKSTLQHPVSQSAEARGFCKQENLSMTSVSLSVVDSQPEVRLRLWAKLVEEFYKNYCPRRSPPLVLPTAPTGMEKYSYVVMNRTLFVSCGLIALLSIAAGSWMFAKVSPVFVWYTLYVLSTELYLLATLFLTSTGKQFNVSEHSKLVEKHPLIEGMTPTVDVYLPVCKEPLDVLANTWKYIKALQYPAGKHSVFVLDDGADDATKDMAQCFGFNYIRRPDRPDLKKAGNLRHAFTQTSGEFFTVFDADFCPRPDYLIELIPYHLANPKCAIVQSPQFFRDSGNQTWIEQGAGAAQEYHYRVTQTCIDRWEATMCVGSNAIYRRTALIPICGSAPFDNSEDIQTGFFALTHGWSIMNIPLVLACGMCPDTPRALFSQHLRWCTGSMNLICSRRLWKSNLSVKQKICFALNFIYYVNTSLQPLLSTLPAPLILWAKPGIFRYYYSFFAFPALILGFVVLRFWARSRYTLSVQYAQTIMSFAYLQAIWDFFAGTRLSWIASGDSKAHKNSRFRNMRVLAWVLTITINGLLLGACIYSVLGGLRWFNLVPALVVNAANLLCMHRFLLYRHPKD